MDITTMRRKELGPEIQSAIDALCQSSQNSFEAKAQIKLTDFFLLGTFRNWEEHMF